MVPLNLFSMSAGLPRAKASFTTVSAASGRRKGGRGARFSPGTNKREVKIDGEEGDKRRKEPRRKEKPLTFEPELQGLGRKVQPRRPSVRSELLKVLESGRKRRSQ